MLVPKDYTVAYEQFYLGGHLNSKGNKNYKGKIKVFENEKEYKSNRKKF